MALTDKIKETSELLKNNQDELTNKNSELTEHRAQNRSLQAQKKQQEAELAKTEGEYATTAREINHLAQVIENLRYQEQVLAKELAELQREEKVLALLEMQQDFWTVAENRLEAHMKDLNIGLEGIDDGRKEPADVLKVLKAEFENGRSFGERAVVTRQAHGFYNQNLRKICEARVDGHQIQPSLKLERFNVLERYFNHPTVSVLWG